MTVAYVSDTATELPIHHGRGTHCRSWYACVEDDSKSEEATCASQY